MWSFLNKILHSMMPVVVTKFAQVKLLHACDLLACLSGVHSPTIDTANVFGSNTEGTNAGCGIGGHVIAFC
jgi:hypothetical protein